MAPGVPRTGFWAPWGGPSGGPWGHMGPLGVWYGLQGVANSPRYASEGCCVSSWLTMGTHVLWGLPCAMGSCPVLWGLALYNPKPSPPRKKALQHQRPCHHAKKNCRCAAQTTHARRRRKIKKQRGEAACLATLVADFDSVDRAQRRSQSARADRRRTRSEAGYREIIILRFSAF